MIEPSSLPTIATYFPVVMCLWFMFRLEKIIKTNTDAMGRINSSLQNVYKDLKRIKS